MARCVQLRRVLSLEEVVLMDFFLIIIVLFLFLGGGLGV
jgi:hypothetical protein